VPPSVERFESFLRCPDCARDLARDESDTLRCSGCGWEAPNQAGVHNLLPSTERAELYPGDREDVIDFCLPRHERRLLEGWYPLEGLFGNKYRWIGEYASARLARVRPGPQRLRIRGHAPDNLLAAGQPVIRVAANGKTVSRLILKRPGLFVVEADLPHADEYGIEVFVSPTFQLENDDRVLSVSLSMIRLVPGTSR